MRDKFPATVVEALAKRAGQRCSHCGLATSGPHDDPSKWVNVGEAAHIKAASEDGPRYDPDQSPKERTSAENGIWLCSKHHTLIDRDVARFPAEVLHGLKAAAEDRIRKEIDGGGSAPWIKRIFSVPYARNIYFTGREEVLQGLAAQLKVGGKAALGQVAPADLPVSNRAAISGLGGIGKTQTAVEFAYRHCEEYRAVFFVRAATPGDLVSGFADIASRLGIAGHESDQNAAAQAARRWLEANEGWLLIFDNADEPSLLADFLPVDGQGHILVTSRAQDFAALSIEGQQMAPPHNEEALAFLLRRTRRPTAGEAEKRAAAELAGLLGNLPLALEQAAAYLFEHGESFATYLETFHHRGVALFKGSKTPVGDHDSLTVTWSLNFEAVGRASRASADLLNAIAFLAPDAIPDELFLEGGSEISSAIGKVLKAEGKLAVGSLAAPLLRYSLVERDPEGRTWWVHRVVQEVIKGSLGKKAPKIRQGVVKALYRSFPWPEFETWPRCERLLPHLLAIHNVATNSGELASLLQAGAVYLDNRARFQESMPLYERSLAIREKSLGGEHPVVASSLSNLANLYAKQGRFADAELLYKRSLAIREKSLGGEHPLVASSLNNLGVLYVNLGRFAEAEPLYKSSLAIREKSLGGKHPDFATSINNLALLYKDQGRFAEAEPLFEHSLAIREESLGGEHPDVAASLNNLALLYKGQARFAEVEPLYKRSLEILETSFGGEHPEFADLLNNLASLYAVQGRFADAEPLFERSLAIREKAFGREHPDVAASLGNLANVYADQGNFAKAETLYQSSLELSEGSLGGNHPRIWTALENLASLRRQQGQEVNARELETRARGLRVLHEARNRRS